MTASTTAVSEVVPAKESHLGWIYRSSWNEKNLHEKAVFVVLPSVFTLILIAAIVGGVYWWMRNRNRHVRIDV